MTRYTGRFPAGTPCWLDLTSPDIEVSQRFYAAVLGWAYSDPEPRFHGYVQAMAGRAPAAGIAPAMAGSPPAWTLYLATDDVEATTSAAVAAGGRVDAGPLDVGDLGRMALLRDPAGAGFGVWDAGTMRGYEVANEPGGLAWEDLRSTDPAAATDFYRVVFGYELDSFEMAGPDYRLFRLAGSDRPMGGMGGLMGADGPSRWLVYFVTADVAASVAAVRDGGGAVTQEPFDTPFGPMAGATDPHGATFMLAQVPAGE